LGFFINCPFGVYAKGKVRYKYNPQQKTPFSKSNKTLLVFLRRECMVVEETKPLLNKNQTNPF